MDDTKQRIADMVAKMDFERKKPVSAETKKETAILLEGIGEALKKMNKLHIGLWYAVEKSDYRSLTPEEAKEKLKEINEELEKMLY